MYFCLFYSEITTGHTRLGTIIMTTISLKILNVLSFTQNYISDFHVEHVF